MVQLIFIVVVFHMTFAQALLIKNMHVALLNDRVYSSGNAPVGHPSLSSNCDFECIDLLIGSKVGHQSI